MILASAKSYLANTSSIRVAHLIEIELAGTDGVFDYVTDYMSDIVYNSKIFAAGKVTSVGNVTIAQGLKNYQLTVTVAGEFQEELNKGTSDESYEGRVINVYRAYLDEQGDIIPMDSVTNGPILLFRGKISRIAVSENITRGSSTVSWSCVGLLADFEKVNGRLTEDSSHRGLVSGGINDLPVPSTGAKRVEYQTDTGFLHANQTVATNIKYLSKEKEYYLKKSWGGLKTKLREREVEVERELALSTSLTAKYIPVVYGVRRVPGIPVFMDVLKDDPTTAYVVYAVCEGEIDAFLNMYVDGVSTICGDNIEADTSGVCMGNMAEGDTLAIYSQTTTQAYNYRISKWARFAFDRDGFSGEFSSVTTPAVNSSEGLKHGDKVKIAADKGAILFTFYTGKPDQLPDQELVNNAAANNFMIQGATKRFDGTAWGADYWQGASAGVSGAALLDTAYVVAKFKLSEERDSIPNVEFVVSGKKPRVYTTPSTYSIAYTLNPVWHLLDYLTSPIYGAGLSLSDLDISTFIDVANRLDFQDPSYETSFITYWRYIGWLNATYSKAIMQCNMVLNTEDSVTKTVESILDQFDGTFTTINGINELSLENDDASIAHIDISEVIGSVTLEEKANKDKWNSLNASIVDPGLNWSTNQINFFNSTYLAEDNNIRKKGRTSFGYITNYYTARAWAERQLNKSRFSRTLSFTTYYKYLDLKPNDNITFTYPRFNYTAAKFRVVDVDLQSDGLVRLKIQRYESSIFSTTTQPKTDIPGGGTRPVEIPQGLGHRILPHIDVSIQPPSVGVPYLILFWTPNNTENMLRYEVLTQENPDYIIQTSPTTQVSVNGVMKNYVMYPIAANSTYTFKVQSITKQGVRSPYSLYTVTTGSQVAPTIVAPVEGFQVTNLASDGTFIGPNLQMEWVANSADLADSYNLEILDPLAQSVVFTTTLPQTQESYSFVLADNISAFAIENAGAVGAYRNLSPRIRAVKDGSFSEWSTLNNGN